MRSLAIKLGLLLAATAILSWVGWGDGRPGPEVAPGTAPASGSPFATPPQAAPPRLTPVPSRSAPGHEPVASLDLNRATADELATLPGVGEVIAGRIVQARETNGLYGTVQQLLEVRGIGEKRLARLRPRVHVSARSSAAPAGGPARQEAGAGRRGR